MTDRRIAAERITAAGFIGLAGGLSAAEKLSSARSLGKAGGVPTIAKQGWIPGLATSFYVAEGIGTIRIVIMVVLRCRGVGRDLTQSMGEVLTRYGIQG